MSMFKRLQLGRVIDPKLIFAVLVGVIVAAGLLFVTRAAFGTIPDAGSDIQACYKDIGGKLRVIDTDAGETCSFSETAISWNQGTTSGGVMFYDSTSCPAGWSEYTPARGRTVVGLPDGGNLNGTVGSALADQENRAHNHGFTIPSGNHTHSVNPPLTGTQYFGSTERSIVNPTADFFDRWIINQSSHNHGVNIPNFSSGSAGIHDHATNNQYTSQVMPYLQLLACEKD